MSTCKQKHTKRQKAQFEEPEQVSYFHKIQNIKHSTIKKFPVISEAKFKKKIN